MRVVFDSLGLQALVHRETGSRLSTLVSGLEARGCSVGWTPGEPVSSGTLSECDVLICTTRYPDDDLAYTEAERGAIRRFVVSGGGLLVMSNHGDLPGSNPVDLTRHDAVLAAEFGVTLRCTWFEGPVFGGLSTLSEASFLRAHPIIQGEGRSPLRSVITSNCCSLVADHGQSLIALAPEMRDLRRGGAPKGELFAVAVAGDEAGAGWVGRGRLVVISDSGFIADDESLAPGPGLIGRGDNALFIDNVVRWLGRELG